MEYSTHQHLYLWRKQASYCHRYHIQLETLRKKYKSQWGHDGTGDDHLSIDVNGRASGINQNLADFERFIRTIICPVILEREICKLIEVFSMMIQSKLKLEKYVSETTDSSSGAYTVSPDWALPRYDLQG